MAYDKNKNEIRYGAKIKNNDTNICFFVSDSVLLVLNGLCNNREKEIYTHLEIKG